MVHNYARPSTKKGELSSSPPELFCSPLSDYRYLITIYFFAYPTVCARMIFWFACNFKTFANSTRSTLPRTTVASPSDAQYR
jgi:hypothetical protein